MEIIYFKQIDSTHKYLLDAIKNSTLRPPIAVVADIQTDGIGSRGAKWVFGVGNLFLSFWMEKQSLPKDIFLQSLSIYFSYLMKETLEHLGSSIWLKWPNDLYIKNKKCGGVITFTSKNNVVGSIGLNLKSFSKNFSKIDIVVNRETLVKLFLKKVEEKILWSGIINKFKIEFYKSRDFFCNIDGNKVPLVNFKLQEDGSIKNKNRKMFSLR